MLYLLNAIRSCPVKVQNEILAPACPREKAIDDIACGVTYSDILPPGATGWFPVSEAIWF